MENPNGRLIARNTLYNLVGQVLPLLVALVAVPILIGHLGAGGFGMLALAWMFVGYFGLFDLGLSRSLTQLVSTRLGDGSDGSAESISGLSWTALALAFGVGLIGTLLFSLLARWIALDVLSMPDELRTDVLNSLYVIAAAIPVIVSTAILRGLLEAVHRFDVINVIRIPMGAVTFAGPLVVVPFGGGIFDMVVVLVAARVVAWLAHIIACLRYVPQMRGGIAFERASVPVLFKLGGWMTVSNLLSPVMIYLDRFLIGVVLTATAVAYYATPWELVTKLLVIPSAFASVLFPAFSFWMSRDPGRAAHLFHSGLKFVLLALLPFVVLAVAFARPGLELWVGSEFAAESYRPMQILALGVFFNGLAAIPFSFIQSLGRPDLTARLHLMELPLYLLLLWMLLGRYGIAGAAVAWTVRVGVDFVVLYWISRRLADLNRSNERKVAVAFAACTAAAVLMMIPATVGLQTGLTSLLLAGFSYAGWRHLMTGDEKSFLYQQIGKYLRWA